MRLWPRLPLPRARVRASQLAGQSTDVLEANANATTASQLFAPTGGARVDSAELRRLRRELEAVARAAGYPNVHSRAANAIFDADVQSLLTDFGIPFGEAIRPEMWAWLTIELVPHLVSWRWGDRLGMVKPERYGGPIVRNTLGRLWYEGNRLDRGAEHEDRWGLSRSFTSDQSVALLERPGLAGNRHLCLAVGEVWSAMPAASRKEQLFRDAMKLLTVRAGVVRFDVLSDLALRGVVVECFASVAGNGND